jgi:hypothetical protein
MTNFNLRRNTKIHLSFSEHFWAHLVFIQNKGYLECKMYCNADFFKLEKIYKNSSVKEKLKARNFLKGTVQRDFSTPIFFHYTACHGVNRHA